MRFTEKQRQELRDHIARSRVEAERESRQRAKPQAKKPRRRRQRLTAPTPAAVIPASAARVRDLEPEEKRLFFWLLAVVGQGHVVDAHEHCAAVARQVVAARRRAAKGGVYMGRAA